MHKSCLNFLLKSFAKYPQNSLSRFRAFFSNLKLVNHHHSRLSLFFIYSLRKTKKNIAPFFLLKRFQTSSLCLCADFNCTNSLANSSLDRCDNILSMVHPVSSICTREPNGSQHAYDPCSTTLPNLITFTPTILSSRAKQ